MPPNKIKQRRKMMKLTQKQLSEIGGIPASTLNEVENGKKEPKVYTALYIARALECSVEYLFPLD